MRSNFVFFKGIKYDHSIRYLHIWQQRKTAKE
jgi:hypothetical protein